MLDHLAYERAQLDLAVGPTNALLLSKAKRKEGALWGRAIAHALHLAAAAGSKACAQLLVKAGADPMLQDADGKAASDLI